MNFVKRFLVTLVIGAAYSLLTVPANAASRFSRVVDQRIASVVKIEVVSAQGNEVNAWLGSGVLIDSKGHILTCAHVVEGYPIVIAVYLYGSSATYHSAIVLRRDNARDIALLQLVNYSTPTPSAPLSVKPVLVGDEVVAIGMPHGFDWSVTAGVVSGLNRQGLALNLLQTDTAINPGNSGGPLFNLDGDIVGINESGLMSAQNMGFAVSVGEIRKFLAVFVGLEEVAK